MKNLVTIFKPFGFLSAKECLCVTLLIGLLACKKQSTPVEEPPVALQLTQFSVDGIQGLSEYYINNFRPVIQFQFNTKLDRSTLSNAVRITHPSGTTVPFDISLTNGDSVIRVQPQTGAMRSIERYTLRLTTQLKSVRAQQLSQDRSWSLFAPIDSTPKFPAITDDSLLTLIQKRTFAYFWDFGHPVSGMARERNTSGELVTTGGTGFGIMSMLIAVERGFITRSQAYNRIQTITDFLITKATRYKGAFAHWLNGTTGATIPFSANDNGADLVETSFLVMGLLAAREYFNLPAEVSLGQKITGIYNAVEWDWFMRDGQQVLYWHWSPDRAWTMNLRIQGWNECLVTYVLAAGSPTHTIPTTVYQQGWARDGAMRNGNQFYGITLPLGSQLGGPLFFSHYSFLGIDPRQLQDVHANYFNQNRAHSLINYQYCVQNPLQRRGYSNACWGLTASDIPGGYTASSPTNDRGVIAPTAAIGSIPYTPEESMRAIRFFYQVLGDQLWKEYGFIDAFSIQDNWFASSFLAIDQGPQIIMIENHRSAMMWNLCMKIPEVKNGLRKLGFSSPHL